MLLDAPPSAAESKRQRLGRFPEWFLAAFCELRAECLFHDKALVFSVI
jgi:hypothetical protein